VNPLRRSEVRARRLLRCYPRGWQERYGEEFLELLVADLNERPQSLSRTLDVLRSGLVSRLSVAGLVGPFVDPEQQTSANLAVLGGALSAFLLLGIAIWAQLSIGWQWSAPSTSTTAVAMVTMSVGVGVFVLLAVLASGPVISAVVVAMCGPAGRKLRRPFLMVVTGMVVLVLGSHHFANGWPGTGGHHWAHQGLVPGGIAAFAWALTLSITSYWGHPGALSAFPFGEIAWMVTSPLALGCLGIGLVKVVRRVDLSARVLRFEVLMAVLASVAMEGFLGAACWWVLVGGSGPRELFRTGALDVAALSLMACAGILGLCATLRARKASLLLGSV
jgi:hypothetical protein